MSVNEGPVVKLVVHCRRCGGWLLSAGSVAEGIGPTCAVHERAEQHAAAALTLFDPSEPVELTLFDTAA
ncbi:DUF6011 domain-containing protein [Nocardia jiangsuensis]|uniref:DUF6011 domain-containing protein n=1 Tax=Nocardia jiangsuensis TaxID=1691563 RepID=A0ABV8DNX5_9NOCA